MCILFGNNSPVLPGGPSFVYRFMFLCMLEILKQIAMYNLLKQTGYTQVVALSVFNLCFPQKQVLILITKPENKSEHWLCLSLVLFVSVVSSLCFCDFLQSQISKALPQFLMQKGCQPSLSFEPHSLGDAPGASNACGHALGFLQHEPAWSIMCRLKSFMSSVHPSAIAISPVALLMVDTFYSILMLEIVHFFKAVL